MIKEDIGPLSEQSKLCRAEPSRWVAQHNFLDAKRTLVRRFRHSIFRSYRSHIFALVILLTHGVSVTSAAEPEVRRVSIIEHGIYSSEPTGIAAAIGTLGIVRQVRNPKLVANTTLIPGRRSVRFGVRYEVHGVPPGAEAELKLITRFPSDQLGKSLHPPSEYLMRLKIGSTAYREFIFDSDHEVIPGEWTFEFWYGSRKIGAQKFCVYEADPSRPSGRAGCSAAIALSLNSRP